MYNSFYLVIPYSYFIPTHPSFLLWWPKGFFFCVRFWKSSPRPTLRSLLPMFFPRSFMVSGLIFKCSIHFELNFMYGVRQWSSFILLPMVVQFSQHHLLKRLSFLHCIFLPPLSKIRWPYVRGFISGLSILFHWSILLFYASTLLSWLL